MIFRTLLQINKNISSKSKLIEYTFWVGLHWFGSRLQRTIRWPDKCRFSKGQNCLVKNTKRKIVHFNSRCNIWHGSYASGCLFTHSPPLISNAFLFYLRDTHLHVERNPANFFLFLFCSIPFHHFSCYLCSVYTIHFLPGAISRDTYVVWAMICDCPFAVLDFLLSLPSFAEINCCSFFLLQSFKETKSLHSGNPEAS